jgi:DNA polymerase I-like protein with 3'-5' exonuclease and polymerase domains
LKHIQKVKSYMEQSVELQKNMAFHYNKGRKRYIPELKSRILTSEFGEREAMNLSLQGSACRG